MAGPPPHRVGDYELDSLLGAGTYGMVYRGRHLPSPSALPVSASLSPSPYVAVKCIARVKLSKATEANLVQEISLLRELRHRNILSIIDFHCPYNGDFVYIVTELCEGGDLAQLLLQRQSAGNGNGAGAGVGLGLAQTKALLQQLASALAYLRSCRVAHFDLKPSNLLLRTRAPVVPTPAVACRVGKGRSGGKGELPPVLVVADFGFAARMEDESFKASVRGSPLYLAPEMWREGSYDARADLWSTGVILYEMLFGRAPFHSETYPELISKIMSPEPVRLPAAPPLTPQVRHLLTGLLQRRAEDRMTFQSFFEHPFVDVEHAPAPTSLQRAWEYRDTAADFEEAGEFLAAVQAYAEAIAYFHAAADFTDSVEERADLQASANNLLEHAQRIKSRHLRATATAGPALPGAKVPPQRSSSTTAARASAGAPLSPTAGPPSRSQSATAARASAGAPLSPTARPPSRSHSSGAGGNAPPIQTAQAPHRSSSLFGSVDAFMSKLTSYTTASSRAAGAETRKATLPLGDGAYCLQLGPPAAITDSLRLPDGTLFYKGAIEFCFANGAKEWSYALRVAFDVCGRALHDDAHGDYMEARDSYEAVVEAILKHISDETIGQMPASLVDAVKQWMSLIMERAEYIKENWAALLHARKDEL